MSCWHHRASTRPHWEDAAACRSHPTSWWFADSPAAVDAFVICATCEVRPDCLAFALAHPDLLGIWGGTLSEDRDALRRADRERRPKRPSRRR